MLSEPVLEELSNFIYVGTKLYSIPSIWNRQKRRFESVTFKRTLIDGIIVTGEVLFRIWMNAAYGYMVYRNLQNPSTIIQALLPATYICNLNWCGIVRYFFHTYRFQVEHCLQNFMKLNAYLAHELNIKENEMPEQRYFLRLMLIMKLSCVVIVATGMLWVENVLEVNAYIRYFGQNPGRLVYDFLIFVWIFWNGVACFSTSLIIYAYIPSIRIWIAYILQRIETNSIGFEKSLRLYRCIQCMNIQFTRAISSGFLPLTFCFSQLTIVAVTAFAVMFYRSLGIISSYLVIFTISWHTFMLVVITKNSSALTKISGQVLFKLKSIRGRSDRSSCLLRPLREIRIYVGCYYFIDSGSFLVIVDIILSSVINVVLAYR